MMRIVIATKAPRVTKREDEKLTHKLNRKEEMLLRKAMDHCKI